jgi:hypothetical protein
MMYCGRDHQVAHRGEHKAACNGVKNNQQVLDREERKLRATPGDMFTPPGATIFEDQAGHFWGIHETRPYMTQRYALVEALLKIKTIHAVQAASDHIQDMLRLCRGDNMGVRDLAPHLLLRLGKDQEAYDFVKWWATTGEDSHYDWGDTDLPYLDTKGADVFEPVERFTKTHFNTSHSIAVTLVKVRLLLDVQSLQNSGLLGEKVPQEILDSIRGQLAGNIIGANKDIMASKDQTPLIKKLESQVKEMYDGVKKSNKSYWTALLNPGRHLGKRPQMYSPGSLQHAELILQYSYDSWAETPGAIEMIRELSK